eukprot:UN01285
MDKQVNRALLFMVIVRIWLVRLSMFYPVFYICSGFLT